jgi:hypothetical protein
LHGDWRGQRSHLWNDLGRVAPTKISHQRLISDRRPILRQHHDRQAPRQLLLPNGHRRVHRRDSIQLVVLVGNRDGIDTLDSEIGGDSRDPNDKALLGRRSRPAACRMTPPVILTLIAASSFGIATASEWDIRDASGKIYGTVVDRFHWECPSQDDR